MNQDLCYILSFYMSTEDLSFKFAFLNKNFYNIYQNLRNLNQIWLNKLINEFVSPHDMLTNF